jgi:hypothetical protein
MQNPTRPSKTPKPNTLKSPKTVQAPIKHPNNNRTLMKPKTQLQKKPPKKTPNAQKKKKKKKPVDTVARGDR